MNMIKSSKHRECKRVRYDRSEAKFMYDFFEKISFQRLKLKELNSFAKCLKN